VPDVSRAIDVWRRGDEEIVRLRAAARTLEAAVARQPRQADRIDRALDEIDRIDRELSRLEDEFSQVLGRVARWATALIAVVTISAALLLLALAGFFSQRVLRRLARSDAALRHSAAQLEEAQRMRAVGQLAGGIAHDFNNLLTVILGYGDELRREVDRDDPRQEAAVAIVDAAERAAELTRQLLAFSRRQIVEPTVVDINAIVLGMRAMIERLIGEHIEPHVELTPANTQVVADASQIEQVVLNLVVNARDAMPGGGHLTVTTAHSATADARDARSSDASPRGWVRLSVADTGTGMSEETRARLFEPFFSTRDVGKGTGLGLSVVYGIIQQYGGRIDVDSAPGRGARFDLWLPGAEATTLTSRESAPPRDLKGDEHILIVEDEHAVRVLAQATLERLGYRVMSARHGEEALAMVATLTEPLHLVVTDVVMPRMGGRVLASRLAERYPHLRVLYVSGYGVDGGTPDELLDAGPWLLRKPFTAQQLASRVRDALERPPGQAQA
jgi:signal transduction histidine kinase/CheY-like chemotaxis protein